MIIRSTGTGKHRRYVVDYRDEHGKRHRPRFTTLKGAEQFTRAERDRRDRVRAGLPLDRGPITYDELAELFLAQYDARSKAWFESMLSYSRDKFGFVRVRELLPERIGAWLNNLSYAPKTKEHILDAMRKVLSQGVELGFLAKSPARPQAVRGPRKSQPKVFPFDSWSDVHLVAGCTTRTTDAVLITFACATGLRPEEWAAIEWRDVDLQARSCRINKVWVDGELRFDQGKSEAAFRTVELQRRAVEALERLPRPLQSSRPIFTMPGGGRVQLDNWRKRHWKPAMEAAIASAAEDDRELVWRSLYQMRHTFACLALDAGAELEWISEQMGHADTRVTLKHYARYRRRSHARNLALLDRFEPAAEKSGASASGGETATRARNS